MDNSGGREKSPLKLPLKNLYTIWKKWKKIFNKRKSNIFPLQTQTELLYDYTFDCTIDIPADIYVVGKTWRPLKRLYIVGDIDVFTTHSKHSPF